MDFYPENYDVTLSVPVTDPAGNVVTPGSVTAVLYDQEGGEVVDLGAQSVPVEAESIDITVPKAHLVLPTDTARMARVLSVTLTLPGGEFQRNVTFGIERAFLLAIMENSFMTYAAAEVMALDHVNADGWSLGDENERKAALAEAYGRMTRIPMRFVPRDAEGNLELDKTQIIPRDLWITETKADFDAYPAHFREALRKAQFIEADNILKGETVAMRRREGVIEEDIGESRVKLSPISDSYDICVDALAALAGYIDFDIQIARG